MTRRGVLAAACVAAAVAAALAGDDVAPPATKRCESADGRVSFELPATWKVEQSKNPPALVFVRAKTPSDAEVAFWLYHEEGVRDARAKAFFERSYQAEHHGLVGGVVGVEPFPHLLATVPDPGTLEWHASIYRVIDRNGFALVAHCDPKTWPAVKDACFAAAASLKSALPESPAPPAGYELSEKDGYEYRVQSGVSKGTVATLHAAVLEHEKRYVAAHGAVPKPAFNRPIVVVSADLAASAAAAGAARDRDFVTFVRLGVLYAVPLRKDDAVARASLATAVVDLLHGQCYGGPGGDWVRVGERSLAHAEGLIGRALPSLPAGFAEENLPLVVEPLEEVLRRPAASYELQSTAYAALFHAGGKPWRDAFAAFLKDFAATGDAVTAEDKHLLSLDQDKLRAAAQAFLKELKPVKLK